MISGEIPGFMATGALFGLTAGISPGPLLALVISETVRHNMASGMKVAIAPLVTDIPIILLALLVFSGLNEHNIIMGIISTSGAIFLVYLGYECIKTRGIDMDTNQHRQRSLVKGIIANALNPHPYLFWITVGIPVALKALQAGSGAVISYFMSFYVMLIGSKVATAMLVDRSKEFMTSRAYTWIMRGLGLALLTFAVLYLADSIRIFKEIHG
jgi:threonine/homoserine/homoserine lactone efflux protein